MQTAVLPDMPEDFPQRIHRALRSWHSQRSEDALADLLLVRQLRLGQKGATSRLISNQILLNGINRLKQEDEEAAKILQLRFINKETAQQVAAGRNISEDMVYQRQRAAIAKLAKVLWSQEQELRGERMRKTEIRLEPRTYTRLFGVTEELAEIRSHLESDKEPWLLALEGMGGLGKTALADAVARQLAAGIHFEEIGWVSVRRRMFHLSGEIKTLDSRPDLTMVELVDSVIEQFDLAGLAHCSDREKLLGVMDFLRSRPCLIVVDNLETVTNYSALVLQLSGLANPSRFLITTRYSLQDISDVRIKTLKQLPRDDALAFIRYEAKTRGLHELAIVPESELDAIYSVTGGNPLAIKLAIGQIHSLSFSVALSRFSLAKGKPVEELLDFFYDAAWQALDQDHRRVLQAMLLVTEEGGRLGQIAAITGLTEDQAAGYLQRLIRLSLVTVHGTMHERLYSLHQLTRIFVARQT